MGDRDENEREEMVVDHGPNVKRLTGNDAGQVFPPELSLFEEPPLLAAIGSEEYVDYRPTSASLNAGSLDYVIPGSGVIKRGSSWRDKEYC